MVDILGFKILYLPCKISECWYVLGEVPCIVGLQNSKIVEMGWDGME